MTRRLWLVVMMVALGACGADDPDVSHVARAELRPRVAEIRALADARQPEQVEAKLRELRSVVDDLVQRGELTRRGADQVVAATARIESELHLITTATTTTTPPPPSHDDEDDEDDEDDKEDKEDKEEDEDD